MEKWQKETIKKNLSTLTGLTNCTTNVLAKLQGLDVFSEEEVESLVSTILDKYQRNTKFYNILKTRHGAYEKLQQVLDETQQSGVANILKEGQPIKPSDQSGSTFSQVRLPKLEIFLSSSLIISTLDCALTKEKVETIAREKGVKLLLESTKNDKIQNVTTMEVMPSSDNRKIKIVHIDNLKQLEEDLKPKNESYEIIKDNFSWKNLSELKKQQLLERNVKFQGIQLPLKQLCENYQDFTNKPFQNLLEKLDGRLLIELINSNESAIMISNGNVPPIPKNYVPRKLKARSHISRNILGITKSNGEQDRKHDILLFIGLELYDLTPLVDKYGNGVCGRSSEVINQDQLSCQAILLEKTDHDFDVEFERICELTRHPVHLFNCIKDKENEVKTLEWRKSMRSLNTLYEFIHLKQECLNEEKFVKENISSMTSFCIAELPGNGKTTLMAKFAQMLIDKNRDNFYTQYVVMSEFIKKLIEGFNPTMQFVLEEPQKSKTNEINSSTQIEIPCEQIFEVLSNTSCQSSFGQAYVTAFVKKHGVNCDYLFDGLDELPQNQVELALSIIQFLIRRKKNYIRVWVTTRPDLLGNLEESLGVLGHTINPFEEEDQIKILTTSWCNNESESRENNAGLKKFAQNCLKDIKAQMSNDEKDIAGIPLLCLMIAEVYQEEALEYSRSNENQQSQQPDFKVSTTKLYEKYIEKRFQSSTIQKFVLENAHMAHAIQLLLSNVSEEIIAPFLQDGDTLSKKDLLSFGIIQAESGNPLGTPRFIHKTIAEYFVAYSLHHLFEQIVQEVIKLQSEKEKKLIRSLIPLCRRVLNVQKSSVTLSSKSIDSFQRTSFKFEHPNICHFLNLILPTQLHSSTTNSILLSYSADEAEQAKFNLWQVLHASVVANFNKIAATVILWLNILLPKPIHRAKFCQDVASETNFKDLLFFAAKYGSKVLMQDVRIFFEEWTTEKAINQELEDANHLPFSPLSSTTLLHVAVEAGNYSVVKCLLKERGYDAQIHDEKYKNLLHLCLLKSKHDIEAKIENKIKIINLLMEEGSASYRKQDYVRDSILSLMIEPVSLKLLFCILTKMKRQHLKISMVKNSEGGTLLHLLPTKHYDGQMTPEKYHQYLVCIGDLFKLEELLIKRDAQNLTAVDWAVSSLDLLDKTLDMFNGYIKEHDIIINAISGQRSAEFLQRLIKKGSRWKGLFLGKTVLHFAAEKYNYEATELFTSQPYNIDVNTEDNDGNTPLHMCLQKRGDKKNRLKTSASVQESMDRQDSLESNSSGSGDTTIINGELKPNNQHRIIAHLIEKGAMINQPNKHGNTPLHFAIDICGGLTHKDLDNLKRREFKNESLALAYIGIILNEKIGSVWHPNLIKPFADALRKLGACAQEYVENETETPLLHLAAKKHSMGVKYLFENRLADANSKNKAGKTALEYMGCDGGCTAYTCGKIKNLLLRYAQRN